tara:strand:+ start:16763 stop:17056 length:294 start_codon:yes stop_codon:yes gene_type:complete
VENNISNQRASITWLQYIVSLIFITQAVFWLTSIYKDLGFEIQKTESNRKEIQNVSDQARRRIENAEERILLLKEIKHNELKIEILEKELKYCQKKQ